MDCSRSGQSTPGWSVILLFRRHPGGSRHSTPVEVILRSHPPGPARFSDSVGSGREVLSILPVYRLSGSKKRLSDPFPPAFVVHNPLGQTTIRGWASGSVDPIAG